MDLSQQCDMHSTDVAEKKAFAIRHLSDALKHLNDVTFSKKTRSNTNTIAQALLELRRMCTTESSLLTRRHVRS